MLTTTLRSNTEADRPANSSPTIKKREGGREGGRRRRRRESKRIHIVGEEYGSQNFQ